MLIFYENQDVRSCFYERQVLERNTTEWKDFISFFFGHDEFKEHRVLCVCVCVCEEAWGVISRKTDAGHKKFEREIKGGYCKRQPKKE